jgi:hypothetical protein
MANETTPPTSYNIGYGKPPKTGQFVKGQSGNPAGRPKGSKDLNSIIQQESRKLVRVNGPNGSRSITKIRATVIQLVNKSLQGDFRAMRDFLTLTRMSEQVERIDPPSPILAERNQIILDSILKRYERTQRHSSTTADKSAENQVAGEE